MADRGIISTLLRPLLLRPSSIFIRFSNTHVSRFQNPSPSYFSSSLSTVASVKVITLNRRRFSFKIDAVANEDGGNGRTERRRKRRELWEELLEDNVEDEDDDRGDGRSNFDLWKILEEIVDNVWILKAFRSYGYLLPFIILSLFFSTGPKAFLVSLAVAIGPSLLFLAFQKLTGLDKRKRTSMANQFMIDEEEEGEVEVDKRRRKSSVRYNASQVSRGVSARMASKFGGWDELDGLETIPVQARNEPKRKRKRIRREESREPLLLRLLVSLFPFLSSLTNMLKK